MNNIVKLGKQKGYGIYVIPSGSCARKILSGKNYKGVVGITCGSELKMALGLLKNLVSKKQSRKRIRMLTEILLYIMVILGVFVLMEGVAWFLHKYVMHGFGWFIHKDHHYPRKGRFEKNDLFGVFFSLISFLFILTGILSRFDIKFAVGIGIMMYGIGYFLVHDIFFHRRIKIRYRPKSKYVKRILNAHGLHHAKSTPKTGVNFGFLYASKKYAV